MRTTAAVERAGVPLFDAPMLRVYSFPMYESRGRETVMMPSTGCMLNIPLPLPATAMINNKHLARV